MNQFHQDVQCVQTNSVVSPLTEKINRAYPEGVQKDGPDPQQFALLADLNCFKDRQSSAAGTNVLHSLVAVPPPELNLVLGSGSRCLAIEYKPGKEGIPSEERKAPLNTEGTGLKKTDCKGQKGRRKRFKTKKFLGMEHSCAVEDQAKNKSVYETDSSTSSVMSSASSSEAKKLRLEEEEVLWNDAVLGSNLVPPDHISVMNEDSSMVIGDPSMVSSSPGGSKAN